MELISKWIGREIEFRDYGGLLKTNLVYRGRCIKYDKKHNLFLVKIKYKTRLDVSHMDTLHPGYVKRGALFNGRHHKCVVKVHSRHKYWEVVTDDIYHILRKSNNRWKSIGIPRFGDVFHWSYGFFNLC